MAGSYNHVVDSDGRLLGPIRMSKMLENGGDVYEAVEEMYGMIWFLAQGDPDVVERARKNALHAGLEQSPLRRLATPVTPEHL